MMSSNNFEWRAAAEEEMQSMEKNGTWTLIEPPKNAEVIGCKWIFKLKRNDEGFAIKHKARLVAQGFSQKFGLNYDEVFAPVVRASTFRTLLAIAGKEKLKVHHYNVKTAFLYGNLKETVLMKQPEGIKIQEKGHFVCKLNKCIYGLKQAAKSWNDKLNSYLQSLGFTQAKADPCLFFKNTEKGKIYLISYVDDLLIASKDEDLILQTGQNLRKHFQLTSLGKNKNYLGIQIEQGEDDFFTLNQSHYIEKVLKSIGLQEAKPSKIPLDTRYMETEKMKNPWRIILPIGNLLGNFCTSQSIQDQTL